MIVLRVYKAGVESLGKHLPDIDVYSARAHVLRIRPPCPIIDIDTFAKMFRQCFLKYARNAVVCASARRPGHDDDVTRTQQDGDGHNIARKAPNEEDCGIAEANGSYVNKKTAEHGKRGRPTRLTRGARWHRSRSGQHDP
jgi:hypothetical protein